MLGIILRGYALMIPTIGLYRFWQATWKRRFYWQNTVIDGEPIEYTGTAGQLLLGFFFALAFFLPIYIAFFVLSMQDVDYVLIGYAVIAAVVWFLMGYAIYRARDFRLSRTLWRGIRFDLRGNSFAYALRRFLWSIANVLTLGLIYPWMGSSLWRYRWNNTWYGDRRFEISGNWRTIAGPYYVADVLNVLATGGTALWIGTTKDLMQFEQFLIPGPIGLGFCAACVLGAFGMLAELILSLGWWKLLAKGATIANPDSLRTVQASKEDRALIGQGLADALNVGAY